MFALESVEFREASLGKDGIGSMSVCVMNPLYVIKASFSGTGDLLAPELAREGLEASVFWWGEAALHDAVSVVHGLQLTSRGFGEGYSGSGFTIILARNSSRGRNGNRSSRGLDTNEPSGFW